MLQHPPVMARTRFQCRIQRSHPTKEQCEADVQKKCWVRS